MPQPGWPTLCYLGLLEQGLAKGVRHKFRIGRREFMIRKLKSGKFRLYSRKKNPRTGKRRNLGTFNSRSAAEKHERAVQYFKHH
jgi:hypothetical protein